MKELNSENTGDFSAMKNNKKRSINDFKKKEPEEEEYWTEADLKEVAEKIIRRLGLQNPDK